MQDVFTREEVIKIINDILEYADIVYDAIQNENTDWYGESLLELIEQEQNKLK